MSETYRSKRDRWQRMLAGLPAELRAHVSLRNVEAVAGLPPRARQRLAEAMQAGLKRLPRALEQLRLDPDSSITDLLNPPLRPVAAALRESPPAIHNEVADLIQMCFVDMPRGSAEALAHAEVMQIARQTAQAHHQIFQSDQMRTDFVAMVVYGLLRQTLEHLEAVIEDTPALRQAFDQGHLPWKPNDWRK